MMMMKYSNDDEDNDQGENGNMDEDDDGEYSDVNTPRTWKLFSREYSNNFDNSNNTNTCRHNNNNNNHKIKLNQLQSHGEILQKSMSESPRMRLLRKLKIEKKSSSPSRRDRSRDSRSGDRRDAGSRIVEEVEVGSSKEKK